MWQINSPTANNNIDNRFFFRGPTITQWFGCVQQIYQKKKNYRTVSPFSLCGHRCWWYFATPSFNTKCCIDQRSSLLFNVCCSIVSVTSAANLNRINLFIDPAYTRSFFLIFSCWIRVTGTNAAIRHPSLQFRPVSVQRATVQRVWNISLFIF